MHRDQATALPNLMAVVFLVVCVILVVKSASPASASSAPAVRYTDNTDDGTTPTDIAAVVVRRTAESVTFRIEFARRVNWRPEHAVQVVIDADRKLSTGETGYDMLLDQSQGYASLLTWRGRKWAESRPRTLTSRVTPRAVTFRVDTRTIRLPARFNFYAVAGTALGADDEKSDAAPSPLLFSTDEVAFGYPSGERVLREDEDPSRPAGRDDGDGGTTARILALLIVALGGAVWGWRGWRRSVRRRRAGR